MVISLQNLFNNLAEEINFKNKHDKEKCESCENDIIPSKWLCCIRNYQKKFDESLKKRFANMQYMPNIYTFFYCSIGVYRYEYMKDWGKFSETLPEKEDFYSHLNIEDITDTV